MWGWHKEMAPQRDWKEWAVRVSVSRVKENLRRACQPVSSSTFCLHNSQTGECQGHRREHSPSRPPLKLICPNTGEALKHVLLVRAEHTLWIFCGILLFLLKWQFCSLSYILQVLRPGSRYEVSVTGVRTGNESGSISTEFTTGEAQQKTRVVIAVCVCVRSLQLTTLIHSTTLRYLHGGQPQTHTYDSAWVQLC